MPETMGKIIKRLRKEHGLTQEELAEQLGVTFQAVSKWENDLGMPDISQIVPLAAVFEVSTDVLFGINGTDNTEDVLKLIYEANALITKPATTESVRLCYNALIEGLKKYPNNSALLSNCLETGISLAYPENDTYDSENGERIYHECIRQADLIIKHGKNAGDTLRAHMIMVLLHSAYGNFEAARKHADKFPVRSDMTSYNMAAYIAHSKKDFKRECLCRQHDFSYHLEAILDCAIGLGCSYCELGSFDDAREVFIFSLELIKLVCENENKLRDTDDPYCVQTNIRERLLSKLSDTAFDKLSEDKSFSDLIKEII